MSTMGEGGSGVNWESSSIYTIDIHIYVLPCEIASQWEEAAWHRELSSVLCDDLEGWDGACGRSLQREGYMYTYS